METNGKLPKSNTILIKDFADKKYRLEIPRYQRPFSWTKVEAQQLIDDILNSVLDNYYIGTIYLHKKGNTIKLIDGQQRSTTLFLLTSILGLTNITHVGKKFRLKVKSGDYISSLIGNNEEPNGFIEKNLYDVYNFMKTYVYAVEDRASKLKSKINEIALTYVDLSDITINPHIIFNALNNRGMNLSTLDKVKNLLLASGDDKDPDKILSKWKTLISKISQVGEKSLFKNFMKEYYTLTTSNHTDTKLLKHLEKEFNMWKKKTKSSEKLALSQVGKYVSIANKYTDLYNAKDKWSDLAKYSSTSTSYKSLQKQLVEFIMKSSFKQGTPVLIKALTLSKISKIKDRADTKTLKNILILTALAAIDVTLSGTRGNVFEKNVKKTLYDAKTLKSLEKKLQEHHTLNETHKKLSNVFMKYSYANSHKAKGKAYGMMVYIVGHHKNINPKTPSFMFNFEHPWKRDIDDRGFMLEEQINSQIGNELDVKIILKEYSKSSSNIVRSVKNAESLEDFYKQYQDNFITQLHVIFNKSGELHVNKIELENTQQISLSEEA